MINLSELSGIIRHAITQENLELERQKIVKSLAFHLGGRLARLKCGIIECKIVEESSSINSIISHNYDRIESEKNKSSAENESITTLHGE